MDFPDIILSAAKDSLRFYRIFRFAQNDGFVKTGLLEVPYYSKKMIGQKHIRKKGGETK